MMTMIEKIEALDEQILCGGCEESYMRAVRASTATVLGMAVRDFVPQGCRVALVCPTCTTIEDGDERL
jgi:hypothetical protein